jgi:acetoin reductase-like protein
VERRLAGKTAIVTGAGQGIGKGIALRLAGEGAAVIVAEYNPQTARAAAAEVEARGGRALAYPVDVADAEAVRRLVRDSVGAFGRIDILVNNAAVMQTKPLMDVTPDDWDRVVAVNERGLFFCLQAVAAQLIAQVPEAVRAAGRAEHSHGKIVNLSSISGRRGRPLAAPYAASKAAVISITQSAALALAPYGINVNAVCPGVVPTPMWEQIDRDRARLLGLRPGEAMASFIDSIPLRRAGTPEDLAAAVAFFCSPDSDYVTGQTLNVDGGYEMN